MSRLRAALLGSVFLGGLALVSGQPAALPNQAPLPPGDPAAGIEPVIDADFYRDGKLDPTLVELGRLLFFDKVLSGNRNIACATCHHPNLGTSDDQPLAFGEGAVGLGRHRRVAQDNPVLGRVPRNAQPLYFKGARQFERLFHDGRVEVDAKRNWPSGFWSPAREQLPPGLDNVLAVQAMFPVTSNIEMAGHKGENEIATAVAIDRLAGPDGAWALIARRLQAIPDYARRFMAAFADVRTPKDITYVHAANAIAAFETAAFRPDDSPFDRYLRTRDRRQLSPAAARGMDLFYGAAGCGGCHSGKFQSDQQFHSIGMPQIGPGKNDGFDQSYWQASGFMARLEDHGRYRVTYRPEDRYKFRTPSLRNVELSGPWGHAGAYDRLEAVVRHHLDPAEALARYRIGAANLAPLPGVLEQTATGSQLIWRPVNPAKLSDYLRRDGWVQQSPVLRGAIAGAIELAPKRFADDQVADLVAFLRALTDERFRDQSHLVPERVPSGLPVDRTDPAMTGPDQPPADPVDQATNRAADSTRLKKEVF